jgi:hypothetical protein
VDARLGGPGSQADNLIINGNISGQTGLLVNNTNRGPGLFGAVIPVVYANGNVSADAFFLSQPIDTSFFDYDLFFRPTGSGIFELRSFLGAGAFVLPQLVTAAQDIWHQSSSTWFDRSTDLRVLLNGGAAPTAYAPGGAYPDAVSSGAAAITPAVWARGSGFWLDRDDKERVTAFGRTYDYNLDRELETVNFQLGLDLGTRDLLSPGDILVFGALGGFVHASLDYDRILRNFDFRAPRPASTPHISKAACSSTRCSTCISSISTPMTRSASPTISTPPPSACAPMPATASAASTAAPSSSRWPPCRSPGPISMASPLAATLCRSTTTPM